MLLLAMLLAAENIHWIGDYERARREAIEADKKLLLLITRPRCEACRKMLVTTLQSPRCVEAVNRSFVAVIVDFEGDASYPIELFYTQEFPAFFFIDPKEETLLSSPLSGYHDCAQLRRLLQAASQSR